MDKKRIEIIITIGLIIIFIFALNYSIHALKRRTTPKTFPAAILAPRVQEKQKPLIFAQKIKEEELEWKRDPFSGKVYTGLGTVLELELKGIIWDEKVPQVLINDAILREGDVIGQCQIIKINKHSCIVNDGTKDIELRLE